MTLTLAAEVVTVGNEFVVIDASCIPLDMVISLSVEPLEGGE